MSLNTLVASKITFSQEFFTMRFLEHYRIDKGYLTALIIKEGGIFLALKGSPAADADRACIQPNAENLRDKLIKEGVVVDTRSSCSKSVKDYRFSTVSEVANIILASNVNAYRHRKRYEPSNAS